MNKLDTSLVAAALRQAGFETTENVKDADVVLINTCSVRRHAEQRALSHLGHLKHIKKTHPELIVGVIGCMAQRLGGNLFNHDVVDIVAGPTQIPQIPGLVANAVEHGAKVLAVSEQIRTAGRDSEIDALDDFELEYDSDENNRKSQAFVRVMRGCNNFCTYCVVPYVRGPEISRAPEAIIEQMKKLAQKGIRQITLLGQSIDSYRYTSGNETYRLAELLRMAAEVDGIRWIRFITSHPRRFDEAILQVMAEMPKICPYLHIPAQSGSDKILKAMNRGYKAGEYIELIEKARAIVPDIAIAGDFIVGFPGETEEDFAETVRLVKKLQYKNIFVFKYSPRPGTKAEEKLADTIPLEVKKQRNTELLEIQNEIAERYNKRFINKKVEVLVEGPSKKPHLNSAEADNQPQLIGRTAADYIVVFNSLEKLAGRFTKVKITKTSPLTLFGQLT